MVATSSSTLDVLLVSLVLVAELARRWRGFCLTRTWMLHVQALLVPRERNLLDFHQVPR